MRIRVLFLVVLLTVSSFHAKGQNQWSEKQAWEWESKIGVIKGFNAPFNAYPGMEMEDILEKASSLGFNSVRLWVPSDADKCITFMYQFLDKAEKYNLTVSPVLESYHYLEMDDDQQFKNEVKYYLDKVLGEFKNDQRIIFWDLVNEPALKYSFEGDAWKQKALEQIERAKKMVVWARELGPKQPVTTSALFLTEHIYKDNEVHRALKELASMSDIHNFHLYDLSVNRMQAIDDMVSELQKLGNRPIICTEAVARTRGGTFARSLTAFSKYHIHFYSWGMYTNDRNWDVAWGMSSFEPYEPWFHDVLHPDGYPYDWRDIQLVRDFHFTEPGVESDPGTEITERWNKWRAWKWMATGPVKGVSMTGIPEKTDLKKRLKEFANKGYNSVIVNFSIEEWSEDTSRYYSKIDLLLSLAGNQMISVLPSLISDKDATKSEEEIDLYVSSLVRKYGFDTRIIAWELYNHPGEGENDLDKVKNLLSLVFRVARFEFPNQPLMATPAVSVKSFAPDFDYMKALIHGNNNGWNKVICAGVTNPEFCNYVWSLSDIISFDSNMEMPETGWLLSIANRYGRPVVCSNWNAPTNSGIDKTLDLFSKNKVYWYCAENELSGSQIGGFQFSRISTPRR